MFVVQMLVCGVLLYLFFFFKQKTAYEMRISDWSSDVCSSDLYDPFGAAHSSTSNSAGLGFAVGRDLAGRTNNVIAVIGDGAMTAGMAYEIGRASCRERVCQYV